MKLYSLKVSGLFDKKDPIRYTFHDDLTILTGKNGSGKTTILKLIWFIISGNILLALKEIKFTSCEIVTSEYTCKVIRVGRARCQIKIVKDNQEYIFDDDEQLEDEVFFEDAEDKARPILIHSGSSIFFPTFRRIEGGFSLTNTESFLPRTMKRAISDFDGALTELSRRLSNRNHVFVSAISSKDINNLLLRQFADSSERVNLLQQKISATYGRAAY